MAAAKGNKYAVGRTDPRPFADAIRRALAQYENKEVGIKRGDALRKVADTIVIQAMAGSKDAWKEIGDRLDGKPKQQIESTGLNDGPIIHRVENVIVDPQS